MKLSTRYGWAGIGGLSLLTLVHWFREVGAVRPPIADHLLGSGPNFAAAIAITFVPFSIWADQQRDITHASAVRAFVVCAAISGVGLVCWELFQRTSANFVFDYHDLIATFVGLAFAGLLFVALTRQESGNG